MLNIGAILVSRKHIDKNQPPPMDSLKLDQSLEPRIMSTAALLESAALAREPKNEIEAITQKLLLKNLLTIPSSSTTALLTVTATPHRSPSPTIPSTTTESMITKEINDAQLNLTKIIYEPDDKLDMELMEKDQDYASLNGQSTFIIDTQVDDDDRLVIDISDDERKEKRKRKTTKGKMLTPLMEERMIKFDGNQLPKSFTYNLETTTTGISSSVKIDILASSQAQQTEATSAGTMLKSPTKKTNITVADELNLLGHEIDRQMSRKTNEILEIIKTFLSNTISKSEFHEKVAEVGNVTMSDLNVIAKKVIKRHKFEPNPNHNFFSKMKYLQFPTSGLDLVNYFENLLPSLSGEKFIKMIKFYEILIKEMLNLNRTKILQYLIDFMVKKKNSQLDLLNFNYLASTGYTVEKNSSSINPLPDSTQQAPSEKKPLKFFDTSYNFVIRSDPIYIMACSKFHTIIRNVIRCRNTSNIQVSSFEKRPFDNNILRNRRIGKRLVNDREDIKETHVIPEKVRRQNEMKFVKYPKIQNSSPILVSDTPPPSENSSPPAIILQPPPQPNNSDKPRILQHFVLNRAFSERPPLIRTVRRVTSSPRDLPKFDFPKMASITPPVETRTPVKILPKRRQSVKTLENQIPVNGGSTDNRITINELKTLSDNGTEIIPTAQARKATASRRKTVDERAQLLLKSSTTSMEVRKIAPAPQMSEPIKPTAEQAQRTLMKRRQSCHERILATSVANKMNESNLGQNYLNFLKTQFEDSKRTEEEQKYRQMQQQLHMQKQQQQQYMAGQYHDAKRMRFEGAAPQTSQPVRPNPVQYIQAQPPIPIAQHQLMQRAPAFYEQQHQKFIQERLIRDRYFDQVETLQDSQDTSPKATRVPQEKSPRLAQRTTINDEKMMLIAYQQLQSLRDSSTIGIQQYTEQLKQLHQYKPGFMPANITRQNSQEPPRENYYQNTQQQQRVTPTTAPPLSFFYPSATNTVTTTSASMNYPICSTDQSLQKKMISKSKTLTYVEPNSAVTKPFYNPPHSTYYADPYAPSMKKTPPAVPTSLTAFHPPQPQTQQQQPQVVERRNVEMHVSPQQLQNYWLLQQQQHNSQPNIARPIPIPRVQGASAFIDPKVQNAALQAFQQEQQSEYYQQQMRQYYQQQHHHPKSY